MKLVNMIIIIIIIIIIFQCFVTSLIEVF